MKKYISICSYNNFRFPSLNQGVYDVWFSRTSIHSNKIDKCCNFSANIWQKFDEISEGLSVNQVERLKVLSEKLDVEDIDAYAENLSVIKESFFSDKQIVESHDVQEENDEIILEEQEVSKPTSDYTSINALVEAFNTKK